jgi:hypothetical protein
MTVIALKMAVEPAMWCLAYGSPPRGTRKYRHRTHDRSRHSGVNTRARTQGSAAANTSSINQWPRPPDSKSQFERRLTLLEIVDRIELCGRASFIQPSRSRTSPGGTSLAHSRVHLFRAQTVAVATRRPAHGGCKERTKAVSYVARQSRRDATDRRAQE